MPRRHLRPTCWWCHRPWAGPVTDDRPLGSERGYRETPADQARLEVARLRAQLGLAPRPDPDDDLDGQLSA